VKNKIDSINVQMENPIANIPRTTISAGLAFSEEGLSKELFKQADEALYRVKTTTRRACAVYGENGEDEF
jgi:PleD family two-component response regulator